MRRPGLVLIARSRCLLVGLSADMAGLQGVTTMVYVAPTKGRRYLSARSAASAESRAMLEKKYPSESADHDEMGRMTYGGWHWSADEHLLKVHLRLERLILREFKKRLKYAKELGLT